MAPIWAVWVYPWRIWPLPVGVPYSAVQVHGSVRGPGARFSWDPILNGFWSLTENGYYGKQGQEFRNGCLLTVHGSVRGTSKPSQFYKGF